MPQQRKTKGKHVARPPAPQLKDALLPKRLAGVASSANGSHPAWRLSFLDLDHAGGWSWQVSPVDLREIISFLSEMERLTWTEVHAQITSSKRGSHRKHHPMPIGQLCTEAQQRLQELQLDDFDDLFRFRLGNKRRLWGILDEDMFYPVWWDSEHKVYPQDHE